MSQSHDPADHARDSLYRIEDELEGLREILLAEPSYEYVVSLLDPPQLAETIHHYARQGWRLVQVVYFPPGPGVSVYRKEGTYQLFFERRLKEPEGGQ